jgi:perosamine synthetase
LKRIFKSSPSKFGRGVPLLWRGNSLHLLNQFIFRSLFSKTESQGRHYLFESGRSAIFNSLMSQGIGDGDEVIVSSFTCEAVTYAVMRTGARVIYVDVNNDLTMNDDEVFAAIDSKTRAVILQNTFGRLGLKLQTIEKLRDKGLFVIEDCALAIGSKHDDMLLGSFGDIAIWSLEVSKTITIGWGGVAIANNPVAKKTLASRYAELGRVFWVADLRRLFQLWFSALMVRFPIPGGSALWYLLYGSRLFRRSNTFSLRHPTSQEKMGIFTERLFIFLEPSLSQLFEITHANYRLLLEHALRLGLECPIIQTNKEYIVSPRLSIYVSAEEIDKLINYGDSVGVEVGRWFSECPPNWSLDWCGIKSAENARDIASKIVNVPCHWSLEPKEIKKLKDFLSFFAKIK